MNKKQMMVEMSAEAIDGDGWYYASLDLPATDYQIRDALQRLRMLPERKALMTISIYNCTLIPALNDMRIDSNNIEEINFLAHRLDSLNEDEKYVFKANIPKTLDNEGGILSITRLINSTYGLDKVSVISNVSDLRELGQFVIDNELTDEVKNVPPASRHLLDKYKVGQKQCNADGGVFVNGRYIVAGEYEMPTVYDGKTLLFPEDKTDWVFKLLLNDPSKSEGKDEVWIELPMDEAKANEIARQNDLPTMKYGIYYGFESSIPQIDEVQFKNPFAFVQVNKLAEKIKDMSEPTLIKFKAILEAEIPTYMQEVSNIANRISEYDFESISHSESTFFKKYLLYQMDTRFDYNWLKNIGFEPDAVKLKNKLGITITDYGPVSARGRSLTELVPYGDEMPNESMGIETEDSGMGGMKLE